MPMGSDHVDFGEDRLLKGHRHPLGPVWRSGWQSPGAVHGRYNGVEADNPVPQDLRFILYGIDIRML